MVQIAVSRLRKLLPEGTHPDVARPATCSSPTAESIDLVRFGRLRAEGQELLDAR